MSDLSIQVGSHLWPTPISLASGTCGYGEELEGLIDWSAVGAIFTKGISLEPRLGHLPPRIWETESGMLNAIGLENVGLVAFEEKKMPFLRKYREMHGGKVFVNLYATSLGDYVELTEKVCAIDGVDGVEVNLSCPNVKAGGIVFGQSAEGCATITKALRKVTDKFMTVKLSPASPIIEISQAAEAEGADALSLINTMPALSIDIHKRIPRLSRGSGGLSGPALRPIAVKMVHDVSQVVSIPIIGIGGVATGSDAVEFLLAGAHAVQVGTASFREPNAAGITRDGLAEYLEGCEESSVSEIIGTLTMPS